MMSVEWFFSGKYRDTSNDLPFFGKFTKNCVLLFDCILVTYGEFFVLEDEHQIFQISTYLSCIAVIELPCFCCYPQCNPRKLWILTVLILIQFVCNLTGTWSITWRICLLLVGEVHSSWTVRYFSQLCLTLYMGIAKIVKF